MLVRHKLRGFVRGSMVSALVLTGCRGVIGDDGTDPTPAPPGTVRAAAFECDPSAVPDELPLRRLSRMQYVNTIRDLVRTIAPTHAIAVLAEIDPVLASLPADARVHPKGDKRGGFRRLDQTVQQDFVNVGYDLAVVLGRALTSSKERIEEVAGPCATDADPTNDAKCLDDLITKVGVLAHRRALGDDERALYRATAGTDLVKPPAIADVIGHMIGGPYFTYHVEHGAEAGKATGGKTYPLSGYELANRLAYHFWQTMPDAELTEAARSGALETSDGYEEQLLRLAADARMLIALDGFVTEWLWLDDLPAMNSRVGDKVYDAFANGLTTTADTRNHMIADVVEAVHDVVSRGGTFSDFFTNNRSYAQFDDVASIYGASRWSPGSPGIVVGDERVGLLTRPAVLATGSANTRPIMKGVFIRFALLCDELPPPPNNAANTRIVLSTSMTTREVVESLTQAPGSVCAGCHKTRINPLGFATENFDALGRHRTAQALFDDGGKKVLDRPIDTTSVPMVVDDDQRISSGAKDLTTFLLDSGRVQACFARQYFRWTFQRGEDDEKDGCALKDLADTAKGAGSMREVLIRIARQPAFKRRTFS